MLCTTCIHRNVCEGLFPADKQECKNYQGGCSTCEYRIKFRSNSLCAKTGNDCEVVSFCGRWSNK